MSCEGGLAVCVMLVGVCCGWWEWFKCCVGGVVGRNIVKACCSASLMVLDVWL